MPARTAKKDSRFGAGRHVLAVVVVRPEAASATFHHQPTVFGFAGQPVRPARRLRIACAEIGIRTRRPDTRFRHRLAHCVAGFVTMWAGYDNGKPSARHYDGSRRRLALAGFAAAARAARLIHRLIWNIDHEL
ncbi:hypothetical protein ACV22V_11085 [Burkholderia sp. AW33-5]